MKVIPTLEFEDEIEFVKPTPGPDRIEYRVMIVAPGDAPAKLITASTIKDLRYKMRNAGIPNFKIIYKKRVTIRETL